MPSVNNYEMKEEMLFGEWTTTYYCVRSRPRKQLVNFAHTRELSEGVHVGIIRPTRVTYVTYGDGAMQIIRDLWSPDGRATSRSSYWKGETHVELEVSLEAPRQLPYTPPPGLR